MVMLIVVGVALGLSGCQAGPDPVLPFTQAGRSEAEVRSDFARCEKTAMLESNGMRSTDVFMETQMKDQCMKRLGYTKR